MELKLLTASGQAGGAVAASDVVFARDYNEALVHQVVTAYQANARGGNRAQKTRGEVAHSTRKPWAQKGTGQARSGMTSSPIWRGGGRAFPNRPDENFSQKVNRKMFRAGLATIVSQLAREERLWVIDSLTLESPKTKALAAQFKTMGLSDVLIVTDKFDNNLYLSSRNLRNVAVLESHQVDPVSLLAFSRVVFTKAALAQFEESFT
jgi:large subunit ribosomal protein L4